MAQSIPAPSTPLVTTASWSALSNLSSLGPFADLPEAAARALLRRGELIGEKTGATIVGQYHQSDHFYFLLQGAVDFEISLESAGDQLNVGRADAIWTPIGWSSFRAPHRYATTVKAVSYAELLRFRVSELEELFVEDPVLGFQFFQAVTRSADSLLGAAREKLLAHLRASTAISHWGNGLGRAQAITRRDRPRRPSEIPRIGGNRVPSQEAMVTNAAPRTFELLRESSFFGGLPEPLLERLAALSRVHYFCRGDVLLEQNKPADDVQILADGRLRFEYTGAEKKTAVLGLLREPGELLSSAAAGGLGRADVTARAMRDGAVIKLSREHLEATLQEHPRWACLFQKRVLWLLSRQLRATRAHLVSETFDREVLAIESVLEQVRTELSVQSPLHKLTHLLKAAVTIPDALAIVDRERKSSDRLAAHTAETCHELLAPIRRENRFFSGLQAIYETVVQAPSDEKRTATRRRAAEGFVRVFSEIPKHVEGRHLLPKQPGNIFIFNHLKNHEHNTLPNGFQLTLDSHFLSALLHETYGEPGVRVVRQSRANEYGHQNYYGRLGHISVYTPESDTPTRDRSARFREFVDTASTHIKSGRNLILAPEGTSYSTEQSPGIFKAGAFRLAAAIQPEPLVVPIAMAHFDRRLAHVKLVTVIHQPFRVSEVVKDPNDPAQLKAFLIDFQRQFTAWVRRAAELGTS